MIIDTNGVSEKGRETLLLVRASRPEVTILILTESGNPHDMFEAIKKGADGYLRKDIDPPKLLEPIEAVQPGETVLPPQMTQKLLKKFRMQALLLGEVETRELLRPRQQEVLQLVAHGYTNKEVVEQLFISGNTVKFHIRMILDRLRSRTAPRSYPGPNDMN